MVAGTELKCRVLSIEWDRGRVRLTARQELVEWKGALIDDYRNDFVSVPSIAVVVHTSPKGALLTLFGNAKGFIRMQV